MTSASLLDDFEICEEQQEARKGTNGPSRESGSGESVEATGRGGRQQGEGGGTSRESTPNLVCLLLTCSCDHPLQCLTSLKRDTNLLAFIERQNNGPPELPTLLF